MPKAFIDDSGTDGRSPIFVLAGWAAPVENWQAFSDDWDQALQIHPHLAYFKSYEAYRCVGQFDGFSIERRDQRVRILAEVINKHSPVQVYCIVVRSEFEKFIKSTNAPDWMHNPYYVALYSLLSAFYQNSKVHGFTEPVDFVFDEQMERRRIENAWPIFLNVAPPEVKPFIGIEPVFLDDRKVKPLQAADLAAWQCREWNEGRLTKDLKKIFNTSLPMFGDHFKGIGIRIDEKSLAQMLGPIMAKKLVQA